MRKQSIKMSSPNSPFFLDSTSFPLFLPSPSTAKLGMGVWVSLSHFCCTFSLEEGLLNCSAPVWGPSQGRQLSMNFSSVGPSHRLSCCSMGYSPSGVEFQGMHGRTSLSISSHLHSTSVPRLTQNTAMLSSNKKRGLGCTDCPDQDLHWFCSIFFGRWFLGKCQFWLSTVSCFFSTVTDTTAIDLTFLPWESFDLFCKSLFCINHFSFAQFFVSSLCLCC